MARISIERLDAFVQVAEQSRFRFPLVWVASPALVVDGRALTLEALARRNEP